MASTPQQLAIVGNQLRPAAGRLGKAYFFFKALQSEASQASWLSLFPADSVAITEDVSDGRQQLTDTDVRNLISLVSTYITFMEQNSNQNLNIVLKLALNPEQT